MKKGISDQGMERVARAVKGQDGPPMAQPITYDDELEYEYTNKMIDVYEAMFEAGVKALEEHPRDVIKNIIMDLKVEVENRLMDEISRDLLEQG